MHFYTFKTKNRLNKKRNFFFFNFLSKFFGDKFKENVVISIFSTKKLEKKFNSFLKFYKKKIKFYLSRFFFKFNCFEFLKLFFLCLKLRDLSSLSLYIKALLEKIQIKFHKTFLKKFELFLSFFFYKIKKKLRIKGFYMDLRGKVSVVGNSKKRHLCIKLGVFSRSRKNLKFFFIKNQINTTTGVLGASYLLSY